MYKRFHISIFDDVMDMAHKPVLWHVIKNLLQVDVYDPLFRYSSSQLPDSLFTASVRSEALVPFRKHRLTLATYYLYDYLLDYSVHNGRNSVFSLSSVWLGYSFFSPAPHDANLGSRYKVRRQLRSRGLSPLTDGMPIIRKNATPKGSILSLVLILLL